MLDWDRLQTPTSHLEVLVEPRLSELLQAQRPQLDSKLEIGGHSLAGYREVIRGQLGSSDDLVVAQGHQPELLHCGVWAKSVISNLLAQRLGGVAHNYIVDHDNAKQTVLWIPSSTSDVVETHSIELPHRLNAIGTAVYEQIPAWSLDDISTLVEQIRANAPQIGGDLLLDEFARGWSASAVSGSFVEQQASSMQSIDKALDIRIRNYRVSNLDLSDFYAALIADSRAFASAYNLALQRYRERFGLRSTRHPMPDLMINQEAVELPLWLLQTDGRREPLLVQQLDGDNLRVGTAHGGVCCQLSDLNDPQRCRALFSELRREHGDIRPKALTFTLWCRLFACDLFIHGISGAKYDRVTDDILLNYYRVEPPSYACVSATMFLPLKHYDISITEQRALNHQLRDMRYNPQRYEQLTAGQAELLDRRAEAVELAQRLKTDTPRDRRSRRQAYDSIRAASEQLLAKQPHVMESIKQQIELRARQLVSNKHAHNREYFMGLFRREDLIKLRERLLNA